MAVSITSPQVVATLKATIQNLVGDKSPGTVQGKAVTQTALTSGTTAGKANRAWESEARTLADTITETISLYDFTGINIGAGSGKDALGQALALVEVVGVLVVNRSTSTGSLLIGGEGSSNAWHAPFNADLDAKTLVKPGGHWFIYSPTDPAYLVGSGANKLLKFEASGGALTYDIYVVGRDA